MLDYDFVTLNLFYISNIYIRYIIHYQILLSNKKFVFVVIKTHRCDLILFTCFILVKSHV